MEGGSKKHANSITALDTLSVHRISSGQVVVDLQTAVKELVENSLDAGATNIEVRFKDYGLESIEVVDNGSGIAAADYDSVGLKHHTSKLASFEDLEAVSTFGFRGEALSSLCALCSSIVVTTATEQDAPMGTVLELDRLGKVKSRSGKVARQKGTTVMISELFKPLPVRRKELERNAKREFGKALNLLNAYALVPCAQENGGVRLTCTHQPKGGKKSVQLRTDGSSSVRASVSALWGPKTLENLVELDLAFEVATEKSVLRRQGVPLSEGRNNVITVRGPISKFALNCGRNGTDRQFYYINGRPCNPTKVQKAFNEVYKTFNATQSPMVIADFILPKGCIDVNVSPDKRTILIHSEDNLVQALKAALEEKFASTRSTYDVANVPSQAQVSRDESGSAQPAASKAAVATPAKKRTPLFEPDSSDEEDLEVSKASGGAGFGTPELLLSDEVEVVDKRTSGANSASNTGAEPPIVTEETVQSPTDEASVIPPDDEEQGDNAHSSEAPASPTEAQDSSMPVHTTPSTASRRPSQRLSQVPIQQIEPPRASVPYSSSRKQLVFNKSGEFWHLSPGTRSTTSSSSDARPRKRQRTSPEPAEGTNKATSTRAGFKLRMAGFAMSGSQVTGGVADIDDAEDEMNSDSDKVVNGGVDDDAEPTGLNNPLGSSRTTEVVPATRNEVSTDSDIVMETAFDIESDTSNRRSGIRHNGKDKEAVAIGGGSSTVDDLLDVSSQDLEGDTAPEYVRTAPLETSVMHYNEDALIGKWTHRSITAPLSAAEDRLADSISTTTPEGDDVAASETLSRVINKADFATMDVIGQFNLGFIIARRRHAGSSFPVDGSQKQDKRDDLFIIDQHAADEKYNFEQLQQTTRIESQALFRPKPLELTAADELVAIENIEVLRRNGFEIEIDDSRPGGGHRLNLVAQPVSKTTVFDIRDLEELLHLLRDSPRGQVVRCSKARSMFAMRACRKSIMVGMPLKHKQMTSVVRHMGTMDQPWNCPHGRPTMRHLADISMGGRKHLVDRSIRWNDFQ